LFLVSLSIWTVRRTSVGVLKMMAMTTGQITSERTSASLYILSVRPRIREFAITVRRPTPSEHQFLVPPLTSDSPLSTSEARWPGQYPPSRGRSTSRVWPTQARSTGSSDLTPGDELLLLTAEAVAVHSWLHAFSGIPSRWCRSRSALDGAQDASSDPAQANSTQSSRAAPCPGPPTSSWSCRKCQSQQPCRVRACLPGRRR
jgi:hypothetical protein